MRGVAAAGQQVTKKHTSCDWAPQAFLLLFIHQGVEISQHSFKHLDDGGRCNVLGEVSFVVSQQRNNGLGNSRDLETRRPTNSAIVAPTA